MIRSLTRGTMRNAVVLAVFVLAGLTGTFASSAPAHAATTSTAGSNSAASTVGPQDTVTGSNGWVTVLAQNAGSLIYVGAFVESPENIMYSYGHWQILTPV